MEISIVIIAKNAERTLKKCLSSLINFDEVILYVNNSTDKTKEIAHHFKNVRIIEGEFVGFGETKNKAASYAKHSWVFSLDSDELLSKELIQSIKKTKLNNHFAYAIKRSNYYKGKKINHCGWGTETILRLYNKETTQYNKNLVHEEIEARNISVQLLAGELKHDPYGSISQFIQKADQYSSIFAKQNAGKRNSSPLRAVLNSIFSFVKTYILKKGFLDGYVGLLIASSHAVTNFYKYMKLFELNKEATK